jgi:hypothetical protein
LLQEKEEANENNIVANKRKKVKIDIKIGNKNVVTKKRKTKIQTLKEAKLITPIPPI